jgi:hypothetical protein
MFRRGKPTRNRSSIRAVLSLAAGPIVACGVLAGSAVGVTAGPALAAAQAPAAVRAPTALNAPAVAAVAPKITICLKSSSSFCVDVKDSKDVSGQPVWLYKSANANDDHFYEVAVPCGATGDCLPGCDMIDCIAFEDVQNTKLCLAATADQKMELIACDLGPGQGGTARAAWHMNGNYVHNIFWAIQYLTAFGPLASGNTLYVDNKGGVSGEWQQWTGP